MGSEQKTGDDCYAYQNTCNVFKVCMGRTEQPYVCSFEAGSSRKLHNSPPSPAMGGTESAQKAELLVTRDSILLPTLHHLFLHCLYHVLYLYLLLIFFKEIHFHCLQFLLFSHLLIIRRTDHMATIFQNSPHCWMKLCELTINLFTVNTQFIV